MSLMDDMKPLLSSYFEEHEHSTKFTKFEGRWIWTTVPIPFVAHQKSIWVPFMYCQHEVLLVEWSDWLKDWAGWKKLK